MNNRRRDRNLIDDEVMWIVHGCGADCSIWNDFAFRNRPIYSHATIPVKSIANYFRLSTAGRLSSYTNRSAILARGYYETPADLINVFSDDIE